MFKHGTYLVSFLYVELRSLFTPVNGRRSTMTGKERLIELLKLLYTKTDEDHPMSTAQIVAYFEDQGVKTQRQTVTADIKTLNNCGIEIYGDKGTQIKYHLVDRQLDLPELKLLVDAVESSKFITTSKSNAG